MSLRTETWRTASYSVQLSHFAPPAGGVEEYLGFIHLEATQEPFAQQQEQLLLALQELQEKHPHAPLVFGRVYMSDAANQEASLRQALGGQTAAISYIEQAPLKGSKLAMAFHLQSQMSLEPQGQGFLLARHGSYSHLWSAAQSLTQGNSHEQCRTLFEHYTQRVEAQGGKLADNCHRTWLFVQNVDSNYAGVVTGRNEHFDQQGLTTETHFISSTGIQGRGAQTASLVHMDALSIFGTSPEQIQYLHAYEHLNCTSEYGVRFERGTAIHYGDRTHVYLSGTASIDDKGQVLHVGSIEPQTQRMWQNVQALLSETDCCMHDMAQLIVYLRDMADYALVRRQFEEQYPEIPTLYLLAPVCRPTWLIEMEGIGIKQAQRAEFAPY